MSEKPNVVMIVADQWRSDSIGYTGNSSVKTPNIDQLAEEGVGFSNAYCQNPVCVPSRNSFLTGWYPHTKGFRTMHYLMDDEQPNILKTMKQSGYHVYWGGRSDFLKVEGDDYKYCSTREDKYSEFFKKYMEEMKQNKKTDQPKREVKEVDYSHYGGVTEDINNIDGQQIHSAIDFINGDAYGDDPFCVYLALSLPHPPYEIEQEWFDQINAEDIPESIRLTPEELEQKPSILQGIRENQKLYNWSDEQLKKMKHVYYAMGTKLDQYIGELLDTLKAKDLYDDTIIVFFSDHGDYTGDYEIAEKNQNTFEDMLTRVPLVIKPSQDMTFEPRKTDALVELIDIQATLYDLLDIQPDHTHFGKSLRHVLNGEDDHRDVVFSEGGRLEGETHAMDAGHSPDTVYWARTTEQEKMPHHTKAMMIRDDEYKYVYRLYEEDEFYCVANDPYERKNLINEKKYQNKIQTFQSRMLRHFFETGDVVPHKRDSRF
ncbi:Sulfatase [Gracilibacillus halophilus YIM-C55.5]|uniref:Sulfatase n=1 Tax=Gracilibacillus halophilus YIM-C55.5 TaxID=1308866 RepID=N4WKZ4_9BACI|nr:sulfatase-like hydrolase/transferase [Gracilibacillus halophilus]ENH96842.1 Sulfatase [Gracilibacillus halophilus YIM-C55.5]